MAKSIMISFGKKIASTSEETSKTEKTTQIPKNMNKAAPAEMSSTAISILQIPIPEKEEGKKEAKLKKQKGAEGVGVDPKKLSLPGVTTTVKKTVRSKVYQKTRKNGQDRGLGRRGNRGE